jgi:RNA polymerase sigma-70 factor (ECF subfamily)
LNNGGGPRQYLRAYLYRIAHNWITDHYRRRSFSTLPLDRAVSTDVFSEPVDALVEEAERRQVRQALSKLTSDQRQVIVLRYLEEWELADIAQAMDKPIGAVKALQHRALNSLRRLLAETEEQFL